jgi:23S rRNA (pseudouridine1915-N3)-methyltransferase
MNVDILMVGKVAEKPYRQLIDQYLQRCHRRMPVEIVPCRDFSEIERRVVGQADVVALDERGRVFSSAEFAAWLAKRMNSGTSRVTFCLGPAEGLPEKFRREARETLALSPLTLNHQLALLVLAEQLYRGLSILFGEPYHK